MPNWKIYYDELCSSRKKINRTKTKNDYYELHHIIPKCLGGTNSADNFIGNYTLVTCTVCSKTGQTNAMKRWHFDNCKFLKKKEVANA